jgi:hypothetical protein
MYKGRAQCVELSDLGESRRSDRCLSRARGGSTVEVPSDHPRGRDHQLTFTADC